ncbi:MAG: ABC transporter permease [Chloroflexi bacterium]|nr:ABC transporter permease [Chloroflexota bacterium]
MNNQQIIKKDPLITVIRPKKALSALDLKEMWLFRELVYFLTWRDLKVRYKQTLLGVLWAVLNPFLTMVVFSIFFGDLANVPSDGVPYPIFAYTALLPWTLFSNALSVASRSLVNNRHMITKVYFPRVILPLSSVLSGLVDFFIASLILVGLMFYYGYGLTANAWTIIPLLLLTLITSVGVGLWLSAANVLYRDVNYITPFLTQFWMFITPIAYGASLLPEKWQLVYALNPMAGVVEGFRWALLGTEQGAPGPRLIISSAVALFALISGMIYFRRMERQFADMV